MHSPQYAISFTIFCGQQMFSQFVHEPVSVIMYWIYLPEANWFGS